MKKGASYILGVIIGLTLAISDAMISYADTAPIEDEIGFEIISWDKFIFKTIIYVVIGLSVGVTIQFVVKKLYNNRKK